MKNIIAPSVLAADFARLGQELESVLSSGAGWIHVDVMDNQYVPNLSMGSQVVKDIRDYGIDTPIDVHLMIQNVDSMIEPFAKAGADYISFHSDAVDDITATIDLIREHNCKPAVAFNANVPLGNLQDYIEDLEMVLIMSVNAGFSGQDFMPESLEKVRAVRHMIDNSHKPIRVEIDGGIKKENIREAADAGADTFVVGSSIFNTDDYAKAIQQLKQRLPC